METYTNVQRVGYLLYRGGHRFEFCIAHKKSGFISKSLFSFSTFPLLINYISGFQHSLPNTLISSAVDTCGFLDTTLWIDQLRFLLGQQAGHLFQHSIQELIFGYCLDHFAFAEDYATTLSTGKSHVGVT